MPKLIGTVEKVTRTFPFHFELRSGSIQVQKQLMGPGQRFLAFVFEGTLLEGGPAGLAHVRLHFDIGPRADLFTIAAHQITPVDSVLEARVRRLESLLDGILELADAADAQRVQRDEQIERMASVMRRLGYKPHGTVDHRRLVTPELVRRQQEFSVRVVCGKTALLDPPFKWLLSVRGVEMRDVI